MMEIRDKAAIFTAPLLAVRPCLADTVATGHPAKMFLKATRPVRPFGPSLVIFVRTTLRRRRRFFRCVSDTINHVIDRADNVAENGSIFEPPLLYLFRVWGIRHGDPSCTGYGERGFAACVYFCTLPATGKE